MMRNEKEFTDKIEQFLKLIGFKTYREVKANEENYRVDLIAYSNEFGWIGFECKHLNTLRQGGVIYEGIEQIKKYKKLTYFDNSVIINRWCLLPLYSEIVPKKLHLELEIFLTTFLRKMGISLAIFKNYENKIEWAYLSIDPNFLDSIHLSVERYKNEILAQEILKNFLKEHTDELFISSKVEVKENDM